MAEHSVSTTQLVDELDNLQQQYDDMQMAYKSKIEGMKSNASLDQAKRDLHEAREACAAMSNRRDTLLDRILDMERASRVHTDAGVASITVRRGSERESRLRTRILPSLNETLSLEVDPVGASRHCGPEAVQSRNERAAAADQQQLYHHGKPEQQERAIAKLPKRARTSKTATTTAPGIQTTGSRAAGATAAAAASIHVFPLDSGYAGRGTDGDGLS